MKFIYRGRDSEKNIVRGIIEAPAKRDALIELKGEKKIVTIFFLREKKEIPALEIFKKRTEKFRENVKNTTKKIFIFPKKQDSTKVIFIKPSATESAEYFISEGNFNIFLSEEKEKEDIATPVPSKPQFKKKAKKNTGGSKILDILPKEMPLPQIYKQKFRVSKQEVKMFFEHLSLLLTSGVSISKALLSLEGQAKGKSFKKIIGFIYKEIQAGNPLSYAISCFPKQFDRFTLAMVTIGETSGTLDKCLTDIAKFIDKQIKVRNTIKGAMIYPIIVLSVLLVMLFLGSVFFIPMFSALFVDLGMELPSITRAVFWFAERLYLVIIIILILGIVLQVLKRIRAVNIRYVEFKDSFCLKSPLIKGAVLAANMFYFSYAMSLMLKNGIRVIDSLHLTADIVNNIYIKQEVRDSIGLLTEGISLSEALEQQPHFSDIITNIVSVGEESGRMEYVLTQMSDYYSEQLNLQINMLMQYIQPAAILLVAAIVIPVVFAIFIPLLSISSGQFME